VKFANPLKKLKNIASVRGHSIDFPGKLPTKENPEGLTFVYVPPALQTEAIAAGLMPESELDEAPDAVVVKAPEDPAARKDAVYKAFRTLVERADREEFAGNGLPKADAVNTALGWKLDGKELKTLWTAFQSAETDA
jgi:Arc/MetJ family transcription regulator